MEFAQHFAPEALMKSSFYFSDQEVHHQLDTISILSWGVWAHLKNLWSQKFFQNQTDLFPVDQELRRDGSMYVSFYMVFSHFYSSLKIYLLHVTQFFLHNFSPSSWGADTAPMWKWGMLLLLQRHQVWARGSPCHLLGIEINARTVPLSIYWHLRQIFLFHNPNIHWLGLICSVRKFSSSFK